MELQKYTDEQRADCILLFCVLTIFSLFALAVSRVPTESEFLSVGSLLGLPLLFASPLILIFTIRCFFVNKSLSTKQKFIILLTYVMIVILGYSVLTLVYDSKIIIGYFEYKEERGFFGADGYKILDKPVYKYENLGFYVLIFGNIIFWLFLLIKKRYEEFKFSVKIFPLIFAIIYFMVLDFPQRHRDTLQEVNHLPKLRER